MYRVNLTFHDLAHEILVAAESHREMKIDAIKLWIQLAFIFEQR